MPVFKGVALSNYLLTTINQGNKQQIVDGSMEAKQVKVRRNATNSQWLSNSVTSGRNPIWYKSFGLTTFMDYTEKEGIVFMRVMVGQFVGGKMGIKSGQNKSVGFQDSPGKWYLGNKDKHDTCTIQEFYIEINKMVKSRLLPQEYLSLAIQFMSWENKNDDLLDFSRYQWKQSYNHIKTMSNQIKDIRQKGIFDKGVEELNTIMKKKINNSAYLKKLSKSYKTAKSFTTAEGAIEFTTNMAKRITKNSSLFKDLGERVELVNDSYKKFSQNPIKMITDRMDSTKAKQLEKVFSGGKKLGKQGAKGIIKKGIKTAIKFI